MIVHKGAKFSPEEFSERPANDSTQQIRMRISIFFEITGAGRGNTYA